MAEDDLSGRGGWFFHEKMPVTDPLDYFAQAGWRPVIRRPDLE
jgi:hypothetical protein